MEALAESTAPRIARRITAAVVVGYGLDVLAVASGQGLPVLPLAGCAGCLTVVLLLQLTASRADVLTRPARVRALILSVLAVVVLAPVAWAGPVAGAACGFLAGSALLLIRGALRWLVYGAVGVCVLLISLQAGLSAVDVTYSVYFTLLTGLMLYGVASLGSLAQAVAAASDDVVRTAVLGDGLRLARDMHDLLGFSLSVLVLKSEVAHRLLPGAPEQARAELRDVLSVGRKALGDVRVVTEGYAPISLTAEAESARSMMTAAEIAVRVEIAGPRLPEALESVLAIVLREAATNILRHSQAERVVIRLARLDGWVRLHVENDGIPPALEPSSTDGSGLRNLAARVQAVGGDLAVRVDGEWLRLTAEAPLPGPAVVERTRLRPVGQVETPPVQLRTARLIELTVICGYGLLLLVNALPLAADPLGRTATAVCMAAQVGLQVAIALPTLGRWARRWRVLVVLAQLVAAAAPLAWLGTMWGSMGGLVAGSVLLLLGRAWRWLGYGAVGLAVLLLSVLFAEPVRYTAYLLLSTLLTGLVLYGVSMLSAMVANVERLRRYAARLAVEAHRLRAAREVNELLGRSLAAINAKSQLAYELLPDAPPQAQEHIADVVEMARRTGSQVRSVANGYRGITFAAELRAAERELNAAGIHSRTVLTAESVPAEVDATLALILRRLVSDVLRRPGVRRCVVETSTGPEHVRLRLADDGVRASTKGGPVAGRGEVGTRVKIVGGRLAARTVDGWQEVVVELPLVNQADKELSA